MVNACFQPFTNSHVISETYDYDTKFYSLICQCLTG